MSGGDATASLDAAEQPSRVHRRWVPVVANWGVVIFFILMVTGFSIAAPETFFTWANANSILQQQAVPAMVALAVIVPLAAGEFDLSVGSTLGFCSVFTAWATAHGIGISLTLLLVLLIGLAIGAFNALLVGTIGVNAFIATLGTGSVLAGMNLLITQGTTLFNGIPVGLTKLAQTYVLTLSLPVFYCLALALALWFLMEHAPFGRFLRATGLGREAARLSGVRTGRWLRSSFMIAAVICAFAGFIQTATVSSAPASIGPEYLLPAYAAAFLGATTIRPGLFNVWGTLVGVALLAVGITGLTILGAPFWVTNVFNGAALIVGVSVAVLVGRLK